MHLYNCIWVVLLVSRLNLAFLSLKKITSKPRSQLIMWGFMPLMTVSTTVMTVYTMQMLYTFCHVYISYGVWPRDNYKAFQWLLLACACALRFHYQCKLQLSTRSPLLCLLVLRNTNWRTREGDQRGGESASMPLVDFGVLNDNLIKWLISCIKWISRF
jgi:hypothetical protein